MADALLEEVTSLRNLLEHKSEEEAKQERIIKGLAKITQNKSEKQPSIPAPQDAAANHETEKSNRETITASHEMIKANRETEISHIATKIIEA